MGAGVAVIHDSKQYIAITPLNANGVSDKSEIYSFKNGELKKISLQDDEVKTISFYQDQLATRLRTGEMRLRNLISGRTIVEGKQVISLSKADLKNAQICYSDIVIFYSDCDWSGFVRTADDSFLPYLTGENLSYPYSWLNSQYGVVIKVRNNQFVWIQP